MITHAAKQIPGLKGFIEDARELDLHYIPSRYPNGLPSGYPHAFYGRETAERAVGATERILNAVTDHYGTAGEEEILSGEGGQRALRPAPTRAGMMRLSAYLDFPPPP